MALQLPDEPKPPWPSMPADHLAMMRDGARDALVGALGRRAGQLAAQGEHRLAAEMLEKRLLPLPRLTADQVRVRVRVRVMARVRVRVRVS